MLKCLSTQYLQYTIFILCDFSNFIMNSQKIKRKKLSTSSTAYEQRTLGWECDDGDERRQQQLETKWKTSKLKQSESSKCNGIFNFRKTKGARQRGHTTHIHTQNYVAGELFRTRKKAIQVDGVQVSKAKAEASKSGRNRNSTAMDSRRRRICNEMNYICWATGFRHYEKATK